MPTTIHQIYFKESQLAQLEQEYIPYFNDNCTPFFENSVISYLISKMEPKQKAEKEYFGVISYQLREKIGDMKTKWRGNIANISRNTFTPAQFLEDLEKYTPDAMSFQRHPGHDPILLADRYHPNFSLYFKHIMREIGYKWQPTAFKNVFYCNFFVATNYWYRRYNSEMLSPAMAIMENMPELWTNSKYPKILPPELAKNWGKPEMKHYPYHTFLCERMFSFFAHLHNLNCKHY